MALKRSVPDDFPSQAQLSRAPTMTTATVSSNFTNLTGSVGGFVSSFIDLFNPHNHFGLAAIPQSRFKRRIIDYDFEIPHRMPGAWPVHSTDGIPHTPSRLPDLAQRHSPRESTKKPSPRDREYWRKSMPYYPFPDLESHMWAKYMMNGNQGAEAFERRYAHPISIKSKLRIPPGSSSSYAYERRRPTYPDGKKPFYDPVAAEAFFKKLERNRKLNKHARYVGTPPKPRYYYKHGADRPITSILKSSRNDYAPFEKFLPEDPSEDGSYAEPEMETARKTAKVEDDEMIDTTMADAAPYRGVHWPAESQITGELLDPKKPPKFFYENEKINGIPKYLREYRDQPPIIEDDSLLLTPNYHYGNEQEKSPSYEVTDPQLEEILHDWCEAGDEIYGNDLDAQPSKEIESIWEHKRILRTVEKQKKEAERIAAIKARHEYERKIREAAAEKIRREEEERLRVIEEQRAAEEEARIEAELAKQAALALIKPLSEDWATSVKKAMANEDAGAVLVHQSQLTRHDLGTLLPQRGTSDDPSGWLNDQIVNNAIALMIDRVLEKEGHNRKSTKDTAPYWAFNSAWLKNVREKGPTGISRWATKRGVNLGGKNLLKAKKIFLPLCESYHWTLLVVSPQDKTIEYLDSLYDKRKPLPESHNARIKLALAWIEAMVGEENFYNDEWKYIVGRSAMQGNASDCGVFTVLNAVAVLRNYEPGDWVQAEDMPLARMQLAAQLLNGGLTGDFDFDWN